MGTEAHRLVSIAELKLPDGMHVHTPELGWMAALRKKAEKAS